MHMPARIHNAYIHSHSATRPERYLFKAGNLFRSITRTERAHCMVNTHACVSNESGVWESWSSIQYEVIWLGVFKYVQIYACLCVWSAMNYHLTVRSCGSGDALTLTAACVRACACVCTHATESVCQQAHHKQANKHT